jgi:ribA/ribD-fused uncharacterized protein
MGKCIDCKRDALKPNKRCAVHLAQVKAAQARREEVKRTRHESPMRTIQSFQGEFRFLSNFHPAPVLYCGKGYPSVENAYQAAKTNNPDRRVAFQTCTAGQAKKMGRRVGLRPDWESIKLGVMLELLRQKFEHNPLRAMLLETKDATLIEGNTWGDQYWGVCAGVGENHLGKLLMQIRSELQTAA